MAILLRKILNYLAKAKEELTYIENYDDNLAKLEQELSLLAKDVSQEALILHELRQKKCQSFRNGNHERISFFIYG